MERENIETKTPDRREKLIIGYANTFHDGAIAMIWKDEVFAESFERSTQIKRALWMSGFYYCIRSLKNILASWNISNPSEIPIVLRTSWDPGRFRRFMGWLATTFFETMSNPSKGSSHPVLRSIQAFGHTILFSQISHRKLLPVFIQQLRFDLFDSVVRNLRVVKTKHHLAHAATAALTSPFDECVVMVLDGMGDQGSSSFFHFNNGQFHLLANNPGSSSLGALYASVTRLCGFSAYDGEEWKVMGLAAYGKFNSEIYEFFKKSLTVDGLKIRHQLTENDYLKLESLVGHFRNSGDDDILLMADLAHNFQRFFTEVVCELAANFHKLGLSNNLAYGGGCALNSSTNGQILKISGFKNLHIPSAPGDDGNALGIALLEKWQEQPSARVAKLESPYLGSEINQKRLKEILDRGGFEYEFCETEESLTFKTAELLAGGKIIGWMQGRAEFGPRALGNRSILADPRQPDMKDRINKLVKFREDYRPLAPSILEEHTAEFFEDAQPSPYMDRTLKFKQSVVTKVPAVVHKDGTGRLQTVSKELNPRYHSLISAFHKISGVPIVLNTSMNVMGKPIVHSVEDAITLFYTTGLEVLVLGNYIIRK